VRFLSLLLDSSHRRRAAAAAAAACVLLQSECHKTLNKKLRPGPGGRLAATEKYATCTYCRKEVLPRPTFMLPLIVAGLRDRDDLRPRKLIALDETAARLLGCTADEFIKIVAKHPSMASLIERLLEGRRFWVRTKENRKRQRQGQDAAAIITELLSLDPAPPLVASASALLRGRRPPAPAAKFAQGDSDSANVWVPAAGGSRMVYKFHVPAAAEAEHAARSSSDASAPASASALAPTPIAGPSSPPVAGATRPSRVFDPVDCPRSEGAPATKRARSSSSMAAGTGVGNTQAGASLQQ
jgi:hypothetical protein